MTSFDTERLHVSSPDALIDTVPYLLGFHPSESLVLLGFDHISPELRRVGVSMRIDLTDEPIDADALWPAMDALRHAGSLSAVAIVFTEDGGDDPPSGPRWVALERAVTRALVRAGIEAPRVLLTSSSHWWSLRPSGAGEPSAGGPRVPCSATAVQATVSGMVAWPDRDALAATLAGDEHTVRARLRPALDTAEERRAAAVEKSGFAKVRRAELTALRRAASNTPAGRRLTTRQVARYGAALVDISVRDLVWMAADCGSLDAEALLFDLHSRLPAPYDAAPMFLYGWICWRAGNGTLARLAAERALVSDPDYSAAMLLVQVVQQGMDPYRTPRLSEPGRAC